MRETMTMSVTINATLNNYCEANLRTIHKLKDHLCNRRGDGDDICLDFDCKQTWQTVQR
jgi:hypothetical protein